MKFSLIENLVNVDQLDKYAAIIGENPSNGARSPDLWNSAFFEYGLNYRMVPLDVLKDNVLNLLDELSQDDNFIGGAIAAPYKEVVANWLGVNITPEASNIGAVNCLYRNNKGDLEGTNTDGEGALRSYEKEFGEVKGKRVIILGTGGAAKAVASYFSSGIGTQGEIRLVGRSKEGRSFANKLNAKWADWNNLNNYLADANIVINCTSLGFGKQVTLSPLNEGQIQRLNNKAVVFDIVYQPQNTLLLKIARDNGKSFIGGLAMNLEQAVLAFNYTNYKLYDEAVTRAIMEKI